MPNSMHERHYRAFLSSFAKLASYELSARQNLTIGWHVDIMADALQSCLDRGVRRLVLNLPPRSLKSHCASVSMPVFALGRDPTRKIMIVAGSRALVHELQRKTIALMRNPRCRALFPHLRPTVSASEIVLPQGGGILYATVGQSLIGRGADIVVIDDPLASHLAQDDTAREGVNAWYDAEVVPRLNDKATGVIILVMQRLHLDDLTSHVLTHGEWAKIELPAVALHDESWLLHERRSLRRSKGKPLQPDREDNNQLIAILREIGAYNFSAQYLQRPIKAPGLHRSGWFWNPRPPDWKPEMGLQSGAFRIVPESQYILHHVFGVGEPPLRAAGGCPYSETEWQQSLIIQQRHLIAAARTR